MGQDLIPPSHSIHLCPRHIIFNLRRPLAKHYTRLCNWHSNFTRSTLMMGDTTEYHNRVILYVSGLIIVSTISCSVIRVLYTLKYRINDTYHIGLFLSNVFGF